MGQSQSSNSNSDNNLLKIILVLNILLFIILLVILILAAVYTPKGVTFIDDKVKDVNDNIDEETNVITGNQETNTNKIIAHVTSTCSS